MNESEFNDRFLAGLGEFKPWRAELVARHAFLVRQRNEVMNLTRIVEPEEMARRHVLDSLAAVPVLAGTDDVNVNRVLDLGTGAGYPGIPLACALPEMHVTLLDSTRKKIDFLKEVVKDIGLEDQIDCVWGRFEEFIRPERRNFDLVLARAVGPLSRLLEWTTNRWFGPLVLWKGPGFEEELDDAHKMLENRKMDVVLDIAYQIPEDPAERRIVVIDWI